MPHPSLPTSVAALSPQRRGRDHGYMSLVSLQNIQVAFGAEDVLLGVSGEIEEGDRIGLVGRNGAGKTTLLKVLIGELQPDQGRRHIAGGVTVGMVEQVPQDAGPDLTVYQVALAAMQHLVDLEQAVEDAAHALGDGDAASAAHYARLQEEFERKGGYLYRSRLSQVLTGLGLLEPEWSRPLSQLSGGQRSRLALAKALLYQPDLLVLDEPTNHIALDLVEDLQAALTAYPGAVVVVSHDRDFRARFEGDRLELRAGHRA